MAKDKLKGRGDSREARTAGSSTTSAAGSETAGTSDAVADAAGGQHHAASAHGRPARIDRSLPGDRQALISLHADARRRRAEAPLGSEAYRAAADEIGRIEVRIADVDRSTNPPQG